MEAETCFYSGLVVLFSPKLLTLLLASLLFRICIYMLLLFDAVKLKLCCVKRVFPSSKWAACPAPCFAVISLDDQKESQPCYFEKNLSIRTSPQYLPATSD